MANAAMAMMTTISNATIGRICPAWARLVRICPRSYSCNMVLLPFKVTLPKPMLRMGVKGYVTVTVTGLLVNQLGSMSAVSDCVCVNASVPLIAAVVLIEMVTWLGSTAFVP